MSRHGETVLSRAVRIVRSSSPDFYSKIVSELKIIDVRNARAEKTVETVQRLKRYEAPG